MDGQAALEDMVPFLNEERQLVNTEIIVKPYHDGTVLACRLADGTACLSRQSDLI